MNVTERIGVSKVQLIVYEKLHWIFREQPIDDCGIDAHIELMDDNCATGKLIAAQIKSGESYFKNESNNEVVYYIDEKHLNYWRSNVLPVIIVLYNPGTEECIWEYVCETNESNKIIINRSHKFDDSAKKELSKIANIEPYRRTQISRRKYIEKNKGIELLQELTRIERKENKEFCETQISIDFGTISTRIGIVSDNKKVSLIKTQEGKTYFETLVGFDENYQYYIGSDAQKRKDDPNFILIRNFKTSIGLHKEYKVFNLILSAENITVLFLQFIINYIEKEYKTIIKSCYISKPVDFSYNQSKAYYQCVMKCGLSINRIISEPTCVAINEKIASIKMTALIIDLGGGTLDLSLIETGSEIIEVLNVGGDRAIGGIDYDFALREYIKGMLKNKYPEIIIDSFLENQIEFKAEEAKITLSSMERSMIIFPKCYHTKYEEEISCSIEVSRDDFRRTTFFLNDKINTILEDFIKQIEQNGYEYPQKVMLSGLGCNIFTVNEIIKKCFPDIPIIESYSDKKIAEGLSIYSGKLQGINKLNVLLVDVFGYDIILSGELFFVNSRINYAGDTGFLANHMPSFGEDEKTSQLAIVFKDQTIPTKVYRRFGITCDQHISLIVVSGKHQDEVRTYDIKNTKDKTVYEIIIDINWKGNVIGWIRNIDKKNIMWKFTL